MPGPTRDLLRLLAGLTVLAGAVAGCGDDDDSSPTTTAFEIGSPATILDSSSTSLFPPVATIAPTTADTVDVPITPFETSDVPFVPPDTSDAPVMISVRVGEDGNGPERIET